MGRALMGTGTGHIHRLLIEGTTSGLSDSQLLERFLDERDESAFTALVERYSQTVFCTCRGVVRDHGTAEDAFQATFLVLVCKARTIRGREAIGGWLHRVAYRIAVQANIDATRRHRRERSLGDLTIADPRSNHAGDDWQQTVHEEIARLSEKYRLPVLLCDLEGKTHTQAAAELRCGEATLRRRLAAARELLRSRLSRRGIALTGAGLFTCSSQSANAGVSAACVQQTIKAATQLTTTAARIAITDVISTTAAALARNSLRAMLWGDLKMLVGVGSLASVLGCIAWGVGAPGQDDGQAKGVRAEMNTSAASRPVSSKNDSPPDASTTITFQGRVVDPDGHPFEGAAIHLIRFETMQPESMSLRATSGADGRYRFTVKHSEVSAPQEDQIPSHTLLALAKGFAFGIARDRGDNNEVTLRLARDDVPISGRIIDLEGRPVAGVKVKTLNARASATGTLDAWLKALKERKELYKLEDEFLPNGVGLQTIAFLIPAVVTTANGTFRIDGVGRDRVVTLQVEAPTIETKQFEVRTRPGATLRVPGYRSEPENEELITIYGARFEHVAGPTRPVEGVVRDQDTGKPIKGIMVRGEKSLGNPLIYVNSITDAEGRYRLIGLPRGREGRIRAIPPSDFPVYGSLKKALGVPRDEELLYLPVGIAVPAAAGVDRIHVEIQMNRGVWVTGKVLDAATGKPVRGYVEYFAYLDNPALRDAPELKLDAHHFTSDDGTFGCVAVPGPGVLAARAYEDRYVFAAGLERFAHKPERDFLKTNPYYAIPSNYHVLAEIDPAPGTVLRHDLRLQSGRSITVTALGLDGKPLTDMKIAGLKDMGYWETPPRDASSHAIIALVAGKARTLTFLNDKNRLVGQLVLRGDETEPRTVILKPWAAVMGRVMKADGEPQGECEIAGIDLPGDRTRVAKDGRFRIEGLIPEQPYDLRILSKGSYLKGYIAKGLKIGAGAVKDLGDVVPVPDAED